MFTLDPKTDQDCFQYINFHLACRGMKPVMSEGWQVYGPQLGTDYQTLVVGPATFSHLPKSSVFVAIDLGSVYEISDPGNWQYRKKEDRIPVRK